MPKYKELYNNDLQEGYLEVYENFEGAKIASIQTAVNNIHPLVNDDKNYMRDISTDADIDEIVRACDDLKKAAKGKFVSKFKLTDIEDGK